MKDSKGFTLIELMLTLAIVAMLLAVAVPSYRSFVQGNRAAAQANTLLRALAYTRSEAVKRATVITICRSSNQSSCGSAWADGWIVFNDVDQDGVLDAGTDTLLQAGDGLSGGSTLTAGAGFVRYTASGAALDTTQFTLTPADCQGDMRRLIQVTGSGQATVQKATCP
ncbi:GspH/FimT family pseudopilin [Nitrococcus mobilis]|uniref:Type II secretion system protein H n=1 Tax=Nitrococcus mobilis Nb-231 TaxID=314278 RepID=A4BTT3_9GAMM|nr:GspH/FimT family pseudopilin [Nitrococcus mobilis]EAR20897.1 putative type-4 fimbrial pilin related signal peptide protein [Nitrococcus mobilis Nb-231]